MIDTRNGPYGLFVLRVSLGVMFIAHAWLKYAVFTMPGFEGFLGQVGLPAFLAWPIVLAELFGGVALVVGFYGRWVAAALIPLLLGALNVHLGNGWLFTNPNGGWEYPAFLVVGALTVALAGEGAFALRRAAMPLFGAPVARTA
ncbi:DoxX family protein [Alsobacter sp. SYSU M60028]|uniref:DoxX family protein n=1 Tax=Alsobacter ponti TaxID=2962936 RepID=A0ABT1LC84_9HYPH|nr:DoxX family protein [Alsobacter ponti]MCP8939039.1 DoxX family protein [Alsobacter ponti]